MGRKSNRLYDQVFILIISILHGVVHDADAGVCINGNYKEDYVNDVACKKCYCQDNKVVCNDLCGTERSRDVFSRGRDHHFCWHENKRRRDNETWHEIGKHAKLIWHQECMQCHCYQQIVTCTIRKCPRVTCQNPQRRSGSCCLLCPDEKFITSSNKEVCKQSGSIFMKKATWKMYVPVKEGQGHCLKCRCGQNPDSSMRDVCIRHQCPSLKCNSAVGRPGLCCGSCRDSSKHVRSVKGRQSDESNLKKRFSVMMLGIFKEMEKSRRLLQPIRRLPPTNFTTEKYLRKGKKDCIFGVQKVYKHGEHFIPEISSCLRCYCQNSNVKCSKVVCPASYQCSNPKFHPQLCCKVCPGVPLLIAKKREEKNVVKITKRNSGCVKLRPDYIHVYQRQSKDGDKSVLKSYYLFNRIARNEKSEIHSWQLIGNKTTVNVELVDEVKELLPRWKYLGYIKERILKRIHRHERELRNLRGRTKCIRKMSSMQQIISDKVRKKKNCKSGSGPSETVSVLKTLQEVG